MILYGQSEPQVLHLSGYAHVINPVSSVLKIATYLVRRESIHLIRRLIGSQIRVFPYRTNNCVHFVRRSVDRSAEYTQISVCSVSFCLKTGTLYIHVPDPYYTDICQVIIFWYLHVLYMRKNLFKRPCCRHQRSKSIWSGYSPTKIRKAVCWGTIGPPAKRR